MKYFHSMFDYNKYDDSVYLENDETHGIDEFVFNKGARINDWPLLKFAYDPDDSRWFIDFLSNDLDWFIVSTKLRGVMEKFHDDIQFLPIKIEDSKSGELRDDFYIANIYNFLPNVFDYENTVYVGEKPPLEEVRYEPARFYALKINGLKDQHVFRIKEYPVPTFMSEEFVAALKEQDIQGFTFQEVILT